MGAWLSRAWIIATGAAALTSNGLARSKVLLIDCHDSYTQNVAAWLAKGFCEVHGAGSVRSWWPMVVPHDDEALQERLRDDAAGFLGDLAAVVLSPGPGHPAMGRDFAETAAGLALRGLPAEVPLLGVCLGHQGMALSVGARVERLRVPRHGIVSAVAFRDDSRLFRGLPQGFEVTRYHSLGVLDDGSLERAGYEVTAVSDDEDCDVLAVEHRTLPRFGVQFHPESVATQQGDAIARNFARMCRRPRRRPTPTSAPPPRPSLDESSERWRVERTVVGEWPADVRGPDVAAAYYRLLNATPAFWLDGDGSSSATSSAVGDASGPHGFALSHDAATRTTHFSDGRRVEGRSLFDVLRSELNKRRVPADASTTTGFGLGLVGFVGYETRSETFDYSYRPSNTTDDAGFIFCGRAVVFDHVQRRATALELRGADDRGPRFRVDARTMARCVREARGSQDHKTHDAYFAGVKFRSTMDKATYDRRGRRALEAIASGESYELCLTTSFRAELEESPPFVDWYARLRRRNPAPHAAFFDLRPFRDLVVASSSPERFLGLDADGRVEARPIKGTAPRHVEARIDAALAARLATSVKTRAENLMIADLLRNDLLRVCDHVVVDDLAAVESFATVHQLVTTLSGTLRHGLDALHLVERAFPPGSMTGAPKRRACEVIADLEQRPRGPYAGALGFFALDGRADLAVLIRTAVFAKNPSTGRWSCEVGAGGALTALSSLPDEWAELTLKADAVIRAFGARRDDDDEEHAPADGDANPAPRFLPRQNHRPLSARRR